MSSQHRHLASVQAPDPGGPVVGRRDHMRAVGRRRQVEQHALVPAQDRQLAAVEKTHEPVPEIVRQGVHAVEKLMTQGKFQSINVSGCKDT